MYNYNLINPINITYRNPKQNPYTENKEDAGKESSAQKPVSLDEGRGGQRHFPNGNKVQVDYTKNKVNISQVVEDFKSTIAAINAPKEISDEVHIYLGLVESESRKESPSREIILSNLKNASKISDKFIEDSLKKPSTVVEDWVNALFLQNVELKADPDFINEDFRVQIPEKRPQEADNTLSGSENKSVQEIWNNVNADNAAGVQAASVKTFDKISAADDFQNAPLNIYNIPQNKVTINEIKPIGQASSAYGTASFEPEMTVPEPEISYVNSGISSVPAFSGNNTEVSIVETEPIDTDLTYSTTAPSGDSSSKAAVSFVEEAVPSYSVYKLNASIDEAFEPARVVQTTAGQADEITPLRTILGEEEQIARNNFVRAKRIVKENGDPMSALKLYDEALKLVQNSGNENLKAAIHFERGKVFDDYDYAEYALKDYNSATKCSDNNLKTHAHLKMGRIYDDYVMFDPAVEQYSLAVETSEEAQNPAGKTRALRYLAALFADRYDKENMEIFNNLAVDSAYETGNLRIIANTLTETAENFEYVGEDIKALNSYKQAAGVFFDLQDYDALSNSYEAASDIMAKLGNEAKAMSLLSKALLYRQKAEL